MAKQPITKIQVINHLERIAKNGNKNSVRFLVDRAQDIIKEVWNDLDFTLEQQLRTVWGTTVNSPQAGERFNRHAEFLRQRGCYSPVQTKRTAEDVPEYPGVLLTELCAQEVQVEEDAVPVTAWEEEIIPEETTAEEIWGEEEPEEHRAHDERRA